ncbi:MAG TPA: thioredoxin family protein [Anaerolineales bacterium]|nr:thioredoxin family protein [Anaerolineales bacterium]
MLTIKVLGPGCSNCKALVGVARKAVASLGIEAEIIKVQDYNQIMQYPILSTPALVVNEKVVVSGRVPGVDQIMTWLADAAMQEA